MKPTIYTTIFGNFDEPKPHLDIDANFVCITDNPDLKSDYWEMQLHTEYPHLHPRIAAKIFKCVCPFDGISLFIDGSIEITDANILDKLGEYLKNGFAVYKHPSGRTSILSEVVESRKLGKYDGLPLERQVEYYLSQGMPDTNLWACGLILRDEKHKDLGTEWLLENFKWSPQDQLSLPYVVWRSGHKIDTIPLNQYSCFDGMGEILFKIHRHNSNE